MLGVIIAVGALAAAVVAVVLEGRRLPVEHQASRCLRLRQSPHSVWGTLTDIDGFTAWRPSLARVERLPEVAGRMRWREHEGRGKITFEAVEAAPPQRFTTRIADPSLPFGGTWTYVITPTPEGCTVTITERGEVYNPIESPRGELGCYVLSDGSSKPARVHMRDPSFVNLQAVPHMVVGGLVADVIAAVSSTDPVMGGADR